ncbi:hypothetical protein F5B22DRAFT_636356 [Xylaria bambusicola]|uniref:uncharacterized protein n=1 Tax=Xylaria bambusicola TaxID=326684 RepID=UPI00200800D2|nr:uncharacterized protein F5B22DRAFT_636356 [Xylaria bambusicola]KAI0516810.1 hypothetical protein F5B22DRAFT_636356 [Xylaria bambusicola]
MDALAVSAAVFQFIDFTCSLIAKGVSIHSSMTGLALDYEELKNITASLLQNNNDIQESLSRRNIATQLTKNEEDLQKIASDCQGVAEELMDVLTNLTSKGPKSKWRSFRYALQATWNEGKVKSLENRLDRYRQQVMAIILSCLRSQAEMLIQEQSSTRQSVERIEELQRNSKMAGDRFIEGFMNGGEWKRDLVRMIHEQGRGNCQAMANRSRAENDEKGRASDAVVAQEQRVRKRILHELAFKNMNDRERRIPEAHEQTYKWIFHNPTADTKSWSSFVDFLKSPCKKIYWITGKPGSGKSTLMKYIRHQARTTEQLKNWSGGSQVIQAAFYFWNSGSHMQMSVEGLLQAVLHDCLQQLPTQVIQDVLPERWEVLTLFDDDDYPWSWGEVAEALRRLIIDCLPEKKFYFMLDGLDECSGDQTQLMHLIRELADDTENLKLCVASRMWNNFQDAFKDRPSSMLHDLSAADISLFITSKFSANEGFAELQVREPYQAQLLLEKIAEKAEGVFLWVHLVVQSLLEGMTNGDGLRDLHSRLEELPPDLEDLYAKILNSLEERYIDQASRLFQIVRACDVSPTLLRIALADLEEDYAIQAPTKPMTNKDRLALCKNMKRKLVSRCRGLLGISSSPIFKLEENSSALDIEASMSDNEDIVAGLEVQYLHRSVRDYIETPEVWSWLLSVHEKPFSPHFLVLLKANLLGMKGLNPVSLSARQMSFHLWMAIKYAKRSLNTRSTEQTRETILLLDEIDNVATLLTRSSTTPDAPFAGRCGVRGDDHWSSFFISGVPDPSFLHLMAICGVHEYLETHLQSVGSKNSDGNCDKMPLIISAIEGTPIILERSGYDHLPGPHFNVLETLLRNGDDCHKPYQGRSAWDLARNGKRTDLLRLFEKYRGKPPQSSGSDNCPEQEVDDGDGYGTDNESITSVGAVAGYLDGYGTDNESITSVGAVAGYLDEMDNRSKAQPLPMLSVLENDTRRRDE